jgi:lysophospholipase L1-like esterase
MPIPRSLRIIAVLVYAILLTASATIIAASAPAALHAPASHTHADTDTVVVIGASVAGGYRASPGKAWPKQVAARLKRAGSPAHVVNASISATRLLTPNDQGWPSSLAREDRDGLAVPGVRTLVLTDVINDIQQTPHQYDPNAIIDGFKTFVATAHARHVRVLATTIPPYGGFARYEADGERCRQAVNTYLRTSHLFDALLDFDAVLKDPADATRIRPAYDSGDHLHPNNAGQDSVAQSIDLTELTGTSS